MLDWFTSRAPLRKKITVVTACLQAYMIMQIIVQVICFELQLSVELQRYITFAEFIFGSLMVVGIRWVLIKCAAKPFETITALTERIAAGTLNETIPFMSWTDCAGRLANALSTFRNALLKQIDLQKQAAESARQQEALMEATRQREIQQNALITDLGTGLKALADGDLTFHFASPFAKEFEPLRLNFNDALISLSDAMARVASASSLIQNGAVEIAQAADDFAQRTERQAAALGQTAASVNNVTGGVSNTATAALETNRSADVAHSSVQRSSDVMQSAIAAIEAIASSSEKVAAIIGMIDEIAFQTNLLSLNAGVEAARAGDAGRGFAVVANEVRSLAQRSADSARQIRDLIGVSKRHVTDGVKLVEQTNKELDTVVSQVEAISSHVSKIATVARDQAASLKEINATVSHIDTSTQQNAAMVEQTAAAAHNLKSQASDLMMVVSHFHMRQGSEKPQNMTLPQSLQKKLTSETKVPETLDGWAAEF